MYAVWLILSFGLCISEGTLSTPVPAFQFIHNSKTILHVLLGTSENLNCETTNSSAVVTLWRYGRLNSKQMQVVPTLGKVAQRGAIFTIHKIVFEDAGQYVCQAKLAQTGREIRRSIYVIINSVKQSLVMSPTSLLPKVVSGSSVNLTCEGVKGSINWMRRTTLRDMAPLPNNPNKFRKVETVDGQKRTSVLTILNVQMADSGIYQCELWYKHQKWLHQNNHLVVLKPEGPRFEGDSQTQNIIVWPGAVIDLNCKVTGFPKPVVTWQLNGKPLSPCTVIHTHRCSNAHYLTNEDWRTNERKGIRVKSANLRDNGMFACTATNSYGTENKHFNVLILEKPVIDKSRTRIIEPPGNTTLTISMTTLGNPVPIFKWEVQPIYNPSQKKPFRFWWIPLGSHTNTVSVTNKISLGAFFRMTATNQAGSDSHVVKLIRLY